MSDEQSLLNEPEPATETAAQAFARLDGRIAMMSRAVEHLAAERASIDIPDYSATLGQMNTRLATIAQGLAGIAEKPAMLLTPEGLATRMDAAAEKSRRTDHEQLVDARTRFDQGLRDIHALVATARAARQQRRHLRWAVSGGVLAGCLLFSFLPGMLVRSMPERWLWPERMAARMIGLDRWRAGERLLETADPERWDVLLAASRFLRDNHAVLDRCANRAQRSGKDARCTVVVKPQR